MVTVGGFGLFTLMVMGSLTEQPFAALAVTV
jgi:hypothetical protein